MKKRAELLFFNQSCRIFSAVDLGNALVLLTWGTKLFLTSVKRGPRGTHLTPFSNCKVFCGMDIAYETNTQLELGCFWKHCLYSLPPFLPGQALCLFLLQKGTFLAHSLAWLEIRDSLCPFILEYFLLISQFKFQLCNYILPTPNSSVISIGYGVLHSLGRTLAVLWGTVKRLPRSTLVPFHVNGEREWA